MKVNLLDKNFPIEIKYKLFDVETYFNNLNYINYEIYLDTEIYSIIFSFNFKYIGKSIVLCFNYKEILKLKSQNIFNKIKSRIDKEIIRLWLK